LITNTPHALEVFTTPIMTFEETPYQRKIFIVLRGFQILNQIKHVEETITQPIAKDQENLEL
jgi:hypothetical protein